MYPFNMETMTCSSMTEAVEFLIDDKPSANGGFREVFKATSATEGYENATWAVKKYLQSTVDCITQMKQTKEQHTKMAVQMQALAKHLAGSLQARVKECCKNEFGKVFVYAERIMGKMESGEYVTIEKFIDCCLEKYIITVTSRW